MVWDIVFKKIRKSDFQSLHWHLLLSYLMVMAAILITFATGVYVFFTRSLYHQLDGKLRTLAQSAAPSLADVKKRGSGTLDQVDVVPWRDIFNRDQQSLEWFTESGQRLARKGQLDLELPPRPGPVSTSHKGNSAQIRTFTISVFTDNPEHKEPLLEGFIRASQSAETIQTSQIQILWGLSIGGVFALGLAGIGGLWLTQKALKPVEQSYRQLKQFTADASHELRSPLTAIKISMDVMLSHPERIHPKDVKKLAAISSATAQMNHLVEDLLFLARTDTFEPRTNQEWLPIALNDLLNELVEFLEPSATAKGVSLKQDIGVYVSVFGDRRQLTRLFSNLLENALQYTPTAGKVVLSLARQHRHCVVSVQDTGIGIPEHQLSQIFNRFWRADQARSQREGGTGLGLSIAVAIATQHGGQITVSSEVGQGSCFRVRLPCISLTC